MRKPLPFLALVLVLSSARADDPPMLQPPKGGARVSKMTLVPNWIGGTPRFWYRNDLDGGKKEFVLVDAEKGTRGPAFDHAKLAAALGKATGEEFAAARLPFNDVTFIDDGKAVRFLARGRKWSCDLASFECKDLGPWDKSDTPPPPAKKKRGGDAPAADLFPAPSPEAAAPQQGKLPSEREATSPDGKSIAFVKDHNVFVRPEAGGDAVQLSKAGTVGNAFGMVSWSPDGKAVVAFRVEPGESKEVHMVESSPAGGGRAKLKSMVYPLPGDKFTAYEPWVFSPDGKTAEKVKADRIDFGRPRVRWAADGHTFTFEKYDRGHQRFRLVEVDAHTGTARNVIDETSETFIWSAHFDLLNLRAVNWVEGGKEIVYASERDGWRHLYLVDAKSGDIKPITKGEFVVKAIDRIDAAKREITFQACGKNPDQDPYLIHHYRINFDGTNLVALTDGNGSHSVQYSPDRKYIVDTYSRADMPPVHELRRTADGKLVCALEKAEASGANVPEVFTAKGRDGTTDIWGLIHRPRNFDPAKKYPVIEYIYAGPHDSHVPKRFSPFSRFESLTELGFIVAQIDGMGTANRSKKFHDVCWKNLKDAGFPDRILWHKAVAAKYPHYDTTRVGIYGTSAGGQNSTGALLFHGDFYKAAVSACGCHDNRMDKASWNEQWMGYPVGPHYAASSNIDHAAKLTGKLLLIVGELDTNVPPESTYRLAGALIKANKDFDYIVVPGMNHSDGGAYGRRRLQDFFVKHLQGKEPPNRNVVTAEGGFRPSPLEGEGQRAVARGERGGSAPREDYATARGAPTPLPAFGHPLPQGEREEAQDPPEVAPPPRRKLDVAPPPRAALDLAILVAKPKSEAGVVTQRYNVDRGNLSRTYVTPLSPTRDARFKKFHADWLAALKAVDQVKLSTPAREELLTLRSRIESEIKELETRATEAAAVSGLMPFAEPIVGLEETRRRMEPIDGMKAAGTVAALLKQIDAAKKDFETGVAAGKFTTDLPANKAVAAKLADSADDLRGALKTWYAFYDGYDPMFTWWVSQPHKQADAALEAYSKLVREKAKKLPDATKFIGDVKPVKPAAGPSDAPDILALIAVPQSEMQPVIRQFTGGGFGGRGGGGGGRPTPSDRDPVKFLAAMERIPFDSLSPTAKADYVMLRNIVERDRARAELRAKKIETPKVPKDDTGIVGRPIGREALMVELQGEMIPYSPEELIELARKELAWCDAETLKAAREMGFGDDWRKATEKVKNLHVPPGGQPKLIRELSDEAIAYLKKHDLVTVPPLAEETWRMIMMTPERQLISPFFTGGEVISVAFPTSTMSHDAKMQSLRGNNVHFSRATVQHELIPGHHLQGFMNPRNQTHRGAFGTPFWTEGWALYWEFVLYEKGFPQSAEDRIGFLTWRKHRCCRIIFSLSYHMGTMTPRECIDLLVDRVGFEPENATAEVRRSFAGGYPPLYQAAYMLGGKQIWSLRKELVGTGKMTDRQFHDAILAEHGMPIAMVRAILTKQELKPDSNPMWKFGDAFGK